MEGFVELKQRRSKAKQAASTTARSRSSGAVSRGVDLKILIALFTELEKAYDDFCVLNDEKLLHQERNLVSILR